MRKGHYAKGTLVNRTLSGNVTAMLFLLLFGFFMVLPMVYVISSSLKPLDEFWYFPPRFLVRNPTARNFRALLTVMSNTMLPFSRYIFNTVFIAAAGTAGSVIFSSLCAFALAKHRFPGQKVIFGAIVTALMFNMTVTAVPTFLIISRMGWIDSYLAYILPAFGAPMGLYLMKQFMEQMIPDSLLEAARIDGAGEWSTFWRIVMPNVRPAWLTLIIFSFQSLWNIGTTHYIFSDQLKTLNYALSQIMLGGIARAGTGAAASVVMMAVPITLFVLLQGRIVETMSTSGMKE